MASVSYNLVVGNVARTAFTTTGLATLASATYVASTAVNLQGLLSSPTRAPADVTIELNVTPGTVSGNKRAKLFCQVSMDGTNFTTGPTSGTTTTDEPNLILLGYLPLNSNATSQGMCVSLMATLGYVPYAIKPVVFNDSGAAFTAGTIYYTGTSGDGT